jgi:predicted AAA+ superfamily ATPase
MRRVGKTTLLKQLIDYLITEKNVKRKQIFFFSFDSLGDIAEKIEEYKALLDVDFSKEKVYIFLDEIQKVPDRQSKVKIYFDKYPNIKFFLTGSSSLYLQKRESLAGRMFEYKIKPLFFEEYLRFKQLDYYLAEKTVYKEKIIKEFENYLFRQFIDIIDSPLEEAKRYMLELKDKVIKEDIVFYFKIEYPQLLLSLFKIIASSPGMLLDYKNFANDLDIDQRTLEKYLYFLTEANLITKVYNFSKNTTKSERKLKKVYLNACSLYTGEEIT